MVYEIKLKSIGEITLLPDSQKIFGFLMSKLNEKFTIKEVSEFVNNVYNKEVRCMISNLVPTGYIPTPKSYILETLSMDVKEVHNIIKKMEYIKEEDLPTIMRKIDSSNNKEEVKNKIRNLKKEVSYISIVQKYTQKFKLESQEKSLPGLPNKAYSLPILEYYTKNENNKEKCVNFSFFVEVDKDSILQQYLEKLYQNIKGENSEIYGLGSKITHGYNTYKVNQISKVAYKKTPVNSINLNMGMLIPESGIIETRGSFLDVYSSNRKSYEISDNTEKIISFISPGSIIQTKDEADIRCIGKCIKNEYNILYRNAIIFGNSFIKKIEVNI